MPQLRFFAGLWTLRGYPTPETEWSLERKFAEIKRQGFDGVGGRLVPEAPELCRRHGLDYLLYLDAGPDDFARQFHEAVKWNPKRINVQLGEHDSSPEAAAVWWRDMVALAQNLRLEIDLEIHRDTVTETPEKTASLAQRYHDLTGQWPRFCFDFSHTAVVKHLSPPYAPRLLDRPDLIALARQVHARPFNGHHAQVPVTDGAGQLTREFKAFQEFFAAFLTMWRAGKSDEETLWVCPENGPVEGGYALSCFPDAWLDAVRAREEIRWIWDDMLAAEPPR